MEMVIQAPAKLNLTLDITGRRPDGYHLLDTVMQTVSLYDEVAVSLTGDGSLSLTLHETDLPVSSSNTAYRAAEAFFCETGRPNPGVAIAVTKRIPMQAGMGGGSADAAGVLVALDRLCDTRLPLSELCRIGLTVGADVPFCLWGGTARATGVGEVLSTLPALPDCSLVIAKPEAGVSTATAYSAVDAYPFGTGVSSDMMAAALKAKDLKAVGRHLYNAFERALQLPETAHICEAALSCGAVGSRMTGSGSAVFALFEDAKKAASLMKTLEKEGLQAFLCHPTSLGATVKV